MVIALGATTGVWAQDNGPILINGHLVHPTRILARLSESSDATLQAASIMREGLDIEHHYELVPGLVLLDPSNSSSTLRVSSNDADTPAATLMQRIKALRSSGLFDFVEPDYMVSIAATPTDSRFTDGTLWGLNNTGQSGGTAGVDIDAVRAWDLTKGSNDVIVAVIDTGIRYTHSDLAAQMWRNPNEIPGNGIDDDSNGYVDDVFGINAITRSGNPMDDNSHGTHCAGTIGAAANDGNPHVGVAWNVRLMACKFLANGGGGSISAAIRCIDYAVGHGARILSNSWGGGGYSQALAQSIVAARNRGAVFIAAAGNDARNNDERPHYPSSYTVDNIVSVAAIDRNGRLATFSNFGLASVDLGAPGVSIFSSVMNSDTAYASFNGTSMATPHVAGVAALVVSRFPEITIEQLIERLLTTTVITPALIGKTATGGRVNAFNALNASEDGILEIRMTPSAGSPLIGGRSTNFFVRVTDLVAVTNATVTAAVASSSIVTFANNGTAPDLVSGDSVYSASINIPNESTSLSLVVSATAPGKTPSTVQFNYPVTRTPENDLFASRIAMSGTAFSTTGTSVAAGREPGEPIHAGVPVGASVWWTWTPTTDRQVTLRTTGSTYDTVLAVYTGSSVGNLIAVAGNDDESANTVTSAVSFQAFAGTAYQIAVDGYNGDTGGIRLDLTSIDPPPAPPNDRFSQATPVVGSGFAVSGTNVNATREPGEPGHAGFAAAHSVWWRWTAPTRGYTTLTTDGSTFDTTMAVYTGTEVSSLTLVASDNNSGPGDSSLLTFLAETGTTYHIAIDGHTGASGTIELALTQKPPPPNDLFVDRLPITGVSSEVHGTNVEGSTEAGEPVHADTRGGRSVWWTWIAPVSGEAVFTTLGSSFDTVMAVYAGTAVAALTPVASNDQDPLGGTVASRVTFNATAGMEYQIAVAGADRGLGPATGAVVVRHLLLPAPQPPGNDSFANRETLMGADVLATASNAAATLEASEPNHAGSAGGGSLWWRWTAPASGLVIVSTAGSSFDTLLAVYTGSSLTTLTTIASNDQDPFGGDTSVVSFNAFAGVTYNLVVDGRNNQRGLIQLTLALAPAPPNDGFSNRTPIVGTSANVASSNVNATAEPGEPNHAGASGGRSVWWTWTAPQSGEATISTEGSAIDTTLAIYTGSSLTALTVVASNDNAFGTASRVVFYASANTTYAIAVDGRPTAAGAIALSLRQTPLVVNDLFADAIVLNGAEVTANGNNTFASLQKEPGEPNHAGYQGGRSLWWRWTAPASGFATVDTAGSTFDTNLGIYTGTSVSSLTPIASNSNVPLGGYTSRATFHAVPGATYHIAVNGIALSTTSDAAKGPLVLHIMLAPPPSNDAFNNRITLAGSAVTASGTNQGASVEEGEPRIGGTSGRSVWWTWTAPSTGEVIVSGSASSFFPIIGVYTGGAVNALTTIGVGYFSPAIFLAHAGTPYHFAIDGNLGETGTARLSVAMSPPVSNDLFANRATIAGAHAAATGSTVGATAEAGEPRHQGGSATSSIWWTWTAPSNGGATLTTSGSTFEAALAVYTGNAVNALTLVTRSGSDPLGGLGSRVSFAANAGTTYAIAVDTAAGKTGTVALSLDLQPPPINDAFTNRTVRAGTSWSATGSTLGASKEPGEPDHFRWNAGGIASAWWEWTAPASGTAVVSTFGSSFGTLLAVYTGNTVNALTPVASNDRAPHIATQTSLVAFSASAGTTYTIAVDGQSGASGEVSVGLTLVPPETNDAFASRLPLTGVPTSAVGSNLGATRETGEPDHAGVTGNRSVWWSWTAPESGPVQVVTDGSSFDTLLGVYTGGSVGALTMVGGNDNFVPGSNTASAVAFTATAGTIYQIAVDSRDGTTGMVQLHVTTGAPVPNDHFAARKIVSGSSLLESSTNVGASTESGERSHAGVTGGRSVWWTWTAPATGVVTFQTRGSTFNTSLAVYHGNAVSALTEVASNRDDPHGHETSWLSFDVEAGVAYQIAVDGVYGASGSIVLSLELVNGPSNDNFGARLTLSGSQGAATGSNRGASKEASEPRHADIVGGKSVWWSWTPNTEGIAKFSVANARFANALAVYKGPSLDSLVSVAGHLAFSGNSEVSFFAETGTSYSIAVDSYHGAAPSIPQTGAFVLSYQLETAIQNDRFANATTLSGSSLGVTGNNQNATLEPGEPGHNSTNSKSVWWKWTAPATGAVTIDTAGSSFDTTLAVYTGTAVDAITLVALNSDDPRGGRSSWLRFVALAGVTYHIAVLGASASDSGTIALNLNLAPPPPNDAFAQAGALSGSTAFATGSTAGASAEVSEPRHVGYEPARSVWWKWTAPAAGEVTVTTASSRFDTVLGVYSGDSLASLALIGSNDNDAGGVQTSLVRFRASPHHTYYIAVDGRSGASGDVTLRIDLAALVQNDDFADRIVLAGASIVTIASNQAATAQTGEPPHAFISPTRSLWWTWTPPSEGRVTISTMGSTFDTVLAVYTGDSLTALVPVAFNNNDPSGGTSSRVSFDAAAGTVYQLAVDGTSVTSSGSVRLAIEISGRPANDHFADRIVIPPDAPYGVGNNLGAGSESGEPGHAGGEATKSVWWRWTAPSSSGVVISTIGSTFDTRLAVYTGADLATAARVASNNDDPIGGLSSRVMFECVAGTTYQIAVDGKDGAAGSIAVSITLVPPDALPPRAFITPDNVLREEGHVVILTAQASTTAAFQWRRNGEPISGATEPEFVLPSLQSFHSGAYSVVATTPVGIAVSDDVIVGVVAPPPNAAKLLNLSTRGLVLTDANVLIAGFVIAGPSDKTLLVRVVGPRLADFGVTGALANPTVSLKRSVNGADIDVATNDDWGGNLNAAEIVSTSARLGAFSLATGSADSVLLRDLPPGQYTAVASGVAGTTGVGIVELYDADTAVGASRLINISTRGFAGVGDNVIIPGFVISPEGPKKLLVRVIGPTLGSYGVPETMPDPHLTVFRRESTGANSMLFANDNWGDSPDAPNTASVAARVGAFPLATGSKDAAFVITLTPGVYTVVGASAVSGGSGVVLVEIYVVE